MTETDEDLQKLADEKREMAAALEMQAIDLLNEANRIEPSIEGPPPIVIEVSVTVEVGNDHAIEGFVREGSDVVQYRRIDGERVTTLLIPAGAELLTAVADVKSALTAHISPGHHPRWVTASDPGLEAALIAEFHLGPEGNVRPVSWGSDLHSQILETEVEAPVRERPAKKAPAKKAPAKKAPAKKVQVVEEETEMVLISDGDLGVSEEHRAH